MKTDSAQTLLLRRRALSSDIDALLVTAMQAKMALLRSEMALEKADKALAHAMESLRDVDADIEAQNLSLATLQETAERLGWDG